MNRIVFLLACVLLIVGASGKHYNAKLRGPTSTAELLRFARVQEANDESEVKKPMPAPKKKESKER